DFVTTTGNHFNYMLEQKHAANLDMAFSPDIVGEIQKLRVAELVLFVTPIWWFSVPAILKGWFDRVLAMGVAWDGGKIYEHGLLRGKQAMLLAAAGGPAEYYREEGRHKATPLQILHPINHGTLAFCGFDVHEPFVALNVLGMGTANRAKTLTDLQFRMEHLLDSPQWLVRY
ncbi:MAG TPA: NAD(P)H-dependent oxidoreductase, partial [Candidatus Saccharimonadales bacterium]|nr:NAD(P)H-dependent oxidoreductase [Candidatus Saccharimonadales bacterium]